MTMFASVNSFEDLKKEYRKLALKYHPDRQNGDAEMMTKVNLAYETTLKRLKDQAEHEQSKDPESTTFTDVNSIKDDGFREVLNKIIHLDLEIEVCGRWVWVSGNTRPHKDSLKDAGFYWASKKKMWYWRPEDAKIKYSTGITDMSYIRTMYGSAKIGQENNHRYLKQG